MNRVVVIMNGVVLDIETTPKGVVITAQQGEEVQAACNAFVKAKDILVIKQDSGEVNVSVSP